MDILLQYLNVRSQKQNFVKVTGVPCFSIFQSIRQGSNLDMSYKALRLIDTLEVLFGSNFILTGVIDAKFCNRKTCVKYSYADFCQLTCGPGE